MIIINAEVRVGEGAIAQVSEAIATMEAASLQEPGCQVYAFSVDVSDPTMVRITERWDSMDDLKKHFTEPHMADFQAALSSADILSMDVQAYEANPVDMPF